MHTHQTLAAFKLLEVGMGQAMTLLGVIPIGLIPYLWYDFLETT